jgi:hypothetical protein
MQTGSPAARADLLAWSEALDRPVDEVVRVLTSDDERSTRLRQSNPFAGVLTQQERLAILKRFAQHDPATA